MEKKRKRIMQNDGDHATQVSNRDTTKYKNFIEQILTCQCNTRDNIMNIHASGEPAIKALRAGYSRHDVNQGDKHSNAQAVGRAWNIPSKVKH